MWMWLSAIFLVHHSSYGIAVKLYLYFLSCLASASSNLIHSFPPFTFNFVPLNSHTKELSMTFLFNDQYKACRVCNQLVLLQSVNEDLWQQSWVLLKSSFYPARTFSVFRSWSDTKEFVILQGALRKYLFGKHSELIKFFIVNTWPKHL